jgi:AcrR family transcriptional regulator
MVFLACLDETAVFLDNGHVSTTDEARPPDRRVQRTRRLLHAAIIELIDEHGWDAITVQEVCQRADIGRSTFYVHFADKEELLVSGFGELRKQLRESVVAADRKPLAFTRALIEHTRAHASVYRALLGRRAAQVAYRSWIHLVTELLDEDVAALIPASPLRKAAVRYLAGALWELLQWWSEQPRRSQAVDLEGTFCRLTMAVLREIQK